jgi:hypothetical protein
MQIGARWPLAPLLLASALGCAQGDSGTGGGRGDTGTSGVRDSGGGRRDAGSMCRDEGYGAACETATDLGTLSPGDEQLTMIGYLPNTGDEDWFRAEFPPMGPAMAGGGTPSIELTRNDGDAFRFEVRATCTASFACGDGMTGARDLGSWSFVDDQAMEGEEANSTRDVPWPSPVLVRVYRAVGAGDCGGYQLHVSR